MTNKIQASASIIRELRINGYEGFIGENIPWSIIDEIDCKLEKIIARKINYDKQDIENKIKLLVSKGTISSLEEESVNKMTGFIMKKLEYYISSGFTQSYHTIEKNNYFSYCSGTLVPTNEFQYMVTEVLTYLKRKAKNTKEFDQLIVNLGVNHKISQEITRFAQDLLLQFTGKPKEVRIGGQIKLHPPKVTDRDSINWHFDGDPRFIKVLCYLEDQPYADGSFSIRGNFHDRQYQGSHIKTIIQSVNITETISRMPELRIQDMGIFLLNSHMPILDKRNADEYKINAERYDTYKPRKFRIIIFKGVECLHRGGNNKQFYRPVYQGIASST